MAVPRYKVEFSDIADAWRIWDARFSAWCRLGRPPEAAREDLIAFTASGALARRDAVELCWDEKPDADAWLAHCYEAWGSVPTEDAPHPGDLQLGFARR